MRINETRKDRFPWASISVLAPDLSTFSVSSDVGPDPYKFFPSFIARDPFSMIPKSFISLPTLGRWLKPPIVKSWLAFLIIISAFDFSADLIFYFSILRKSKIVQAYSPSLTTNPAISKDLSKRLSTAIRSLRLQISKEIGPRPSNVGMPIAAVKLPSEPPGECTR